MLQKNGKEWNNNCCNKISCDKMEKQKFLNATYHIDWHFSMPCDFLFCSLINVSLLEISAINYELQWNTKMHFTFKFNGFCYNKMPHLKFLCFVYCNIYISLDHFDVKDNNITNIFMWNKSRLQAVLQRCLSFLLALHCSFSDG